MTPKKAGAEVVALLRELSELLPHLSPNQKRVMGSTYGPARTNNCADRLDAATKEEFGE